MIDTLLPSTVRTRDGLYLHLEGAGHAAMLDLMADAGMDRAIYS